MEESKQPIDVGEYLFRRLREVGVQHIHGLPGDFNLQALDYIPKVGLKWVGDANELNAGYSADGYARIKGISALVTTFGVGELSAINAIAGSFAEFVPVVHIVGCPSTVSQRNGMLLHHTLGNGDFRVFSEIGRQISCSTAILSHPEQIAHQIDEVIRECYIQSRPGYIMLPTDMVQKKVEGARLKTPLDMTFPPNNPEVEDYCLNAICKHVEAAKTPIILVDACAIRHRALKETHDLIAATGLPTYVTPMSKGAVDETIPNYGGVYAGSGSSKEVRERVESADLVFTIGSIQSDFNTTGFTYRVSQLNTIDFHSTYIRVKYSEYPGLRMNGVISKLAKRIQDGKLKIASPEPLKAPDNQSVEGELQTKGHDITHAYLWPRLGRWFREGDIIITETGTAEFGIITTRFPAKARAINQVLWGSIGYATGACQGAALAAIDEAAETKKEPSRVVLWTGEGSFQLTAQTVSTMLRNNLTPIIFVINNNGYTIERWIHGMEADYNDVQPWRYTQIPHVFGAKEGQAKSYSVSTKDELEKLLGDEQFNTGKFLRFVEVIMPLKDAPVGLKLTAEASARTNTRLD
ncbi:pyruvate decarboxylase-like protein [Eremomyces bilateralis CBS 781.70]|uniref:Pyruvate decarboxylase n=1 Tax=Eremomyces bilateralis CBS 781.70 TaxID=1392243 RepID=A0A6G1FRR8_9PEZI|nr:pyruvate decarboxylase-like protein [Eremomyces bilateralis CBS 781.70]KAF1808484.1 pyruvate decarboxylase-like protein [Eremomyces bilateralis CBS 781.70]